MISKLGLGILSAVAMALFVTPSTSLAASSDKTKTQIKKYSKKLKALPNGAAPANVVSKYVTKLAKLDPKKASKYYKTGLTKLAIGPSSRSDAETLAKKVDKTVQKSDLPDSQKSKVSKQVSKEETKYNPLPYQASVTLGWAASLA